MKLKFNNSLTVLFLSSILSFILFKVFSIEGDLKSNLFNKHRSLNTYGETNTPKERAEQERLMRMDPKTGEVPYHLLFEEYERIRNLPEVDPLNIVWEERGPFNVGGRTRAMMWDPNDPAHLKFWAGGVTGGLWYTDNILNPTAYWHKVDDFWDNLCIGCIAYDPSNTQVYYVGTGEGWKGFQGYGIWKSTDAGATWNLLLSTSGGSTDHFLMVQKIVVSDNGFVYAATYHSGVQRSTDGGASWNAVLNKTTLDTSFSNRAADLEITADGDIIAAMGFGDEWVGGQALANSDGVYISPTGNAGDWTRLNVEGSGFPTVTDTIKRIELAVAPSDANIIYALVENDSLSDKPHIIESTIKGIYKSNNKGQSWVSLSIPILGIKNDIDTIYFSGDQTGYDLIAAVHPNDPNRLFVGGVSLHKCTDGGSNNIWTRIDGIHDDHHAMAFRPGDPKFLVFGNDGGVDITENCEENYISWYSRDQGYRVTQFHTCTLHPRWGVNYFMGGTQDNYTQIFSNSGMNWTRTVLKADGGFGYIFKSNPSYQIASKQGDRFYLSTDGGNSFNENNPIYHNKTKGKFISPWDYDEDDDVLYASYSPDSILIIKNVSTHLSTPSTSTYQTYNGLFQNWTTAFKVSPFSDKTVFIGTQGIGSAGLKSKLFKITNASSISNYNVYEIGDANFPIAYTNCIEFGANEEHILVIFSNYGVPSVWETFDGGANWEDREGDLPNVPVLWGIYNPLDYRQVLLATDLGIYTTEDITTNPVHWVLASNGMGNVRTSMLRVRESDNFVIASTFGRGIFSTNSLSVSPSIKILAEDGETDDVFGATVTTNGDFALIGAPYEDEKGNEAGAVYFFEQLNNQWIQSDKKVAPDGSAGDNFGGSVDMMDDLAIVGARLNGQSGAAYIYRLSGNTWNLEAKITPDDGNNGDNFSQSVAVFGERVVVGATGAGNYGAVYVFDYQAGNWIQTDKIEPEDGEVGDLFGHSVDMDAYSIIVGNPFDDDNGQFSGSAYIYQYDNGWFLDEKVTANDGDELDEFGFSVSIYYSNAVVGAHKDEGVNGQPDAGSAYVFLNQAGPGWIESTKLYAQDAWNYQYFGTDVSIYEDYILVGAERDIELDYWSGAAYVFRLDNSSSTWVQQNKLYAEDGEASDLFGHSVALFGTTAIASSIGDDDKGEGSGSAYIFNSIVDTSSLPILSVMPPSFEVSSAQNTININISNNSPAYTMHWTAYSLDPWLQFVGDSSGTNSRTITVNVDENLYCPRRGRIIIRAPGALHSPGEVYISQKAGSNSNEVNITLPDLNEHDHFGWSVDVDGEYAVVGTPQDSEFELNAGAVYVFERDGCCDWLLKGKLRLEYPGSYNQLGISVAISGDIVVAGMRGINSAYIFKKPSTGWQNMTETARLYTSSGAPFAGFGESVDISGENIVIGAYANSTVFFYERPEDGWQDMTETVYYIHSINWGAFGKSVAIDGAYAIVGAETDEGQPGGAAYVFKNDWGWGEQAKLVPSDGQISDWFGGSVDIDNDRIIVGARGTGAAYIFKNTGETWIEEQKLTGGSSFANGIKCVTIDGQYALVGAYYNSDSLYASGSAYSFVLTEAGWSFSKQIFNSNFAEEDLFGAAVKIAGPYTIIGAYGKANTNGLDAGAAYIYCTEGDIVTSVLTPQQEQTLPICYDLKQNYPNPFNPVTTIVFDLPRPTDITLKIYTILGEEVTTIVSDRLPAGTHKYTWNPVSLASGVYLYRIESKEYTITKKMVYLK